MLTFREALLVMAVSPVLAWVFNRYRWNISLWRLRWRLPALAVLFTVMLGAIPAGFYYHYHPIPFTTERVTFYAVATKTDQFGQNPEANFCDEATADAVAQVLASRQVPPPQYWQVYVLRIQVTVWRSNHKGVPWDPHFPGLKCQKLNPFDRVALSTLVPGAPGSRPEPERGYR